MWPWPCLMQLPCVASEPALKGAGAGFGGVRERGGVRPVVGASVVVRGAAKRPPCDGASVRWGQRGRFPEQGLCGASEGPRAAHGLWRRGNTA